MRSRRAVARTMAAVVVFASALSAATATRSEAAPSTTGVTPLPHPGPLGIAWGKSPAAARKALTKRLALVEEKPGNEPPYNTVDQRYTGEFAKMETIDIFLRFHRDEFFFAAVTLSTAKAGSASAVFEAIVKEMTKAYGKPKRQTVPPRLASRQAILDNVPLENRGWVLPMLWNEAKSKDAQDDLQAGSLKDLLIRVSLWDPFAGWKFNNGVTVQTFIQQLRAEGADPQAPSELRPVWIFSKDDAYKKWRQDTRPPRPPVVVEPRDF